MLSGKLRKGLHGILAAKYNNGNSLNPMENPNGQNTVQASVQDRYRSPHHVAQDQAYSQRCDAGSQQGNRQTNPRAWGFGDAAY